MHLHNTICIQSAQRFFFGFFSIMLICLFHNNLFFLSIFGIIFPSLLDVLFYNSINFLVFFAILIEEIGNLLYLAFLLCACLDSVCALITILIFKFLHDCIYVCDFVGMASNEFFLTNCLLYTEFLNEHFSIRNDRNIEWAKTEFNNTGQNRISMYKIKIV